MTPRRLVRSSPGAFQLAHELRVGAVLVALGMLPWIACDGGAKQPDNGGPTHSPDASRGGTGNDGGASGVAGSAGSSGQSPEDACTRGSCLVDSGAPDRAGDASDSPPDSCNLPLPPWSPACGAERCGNGTIDTCVIQCPQDWCSRQETCDKVVPPGTSCASLGYSGGELACSSWCAFDERGCTECAPLGGPLLACQRACIESAQASKLALGATDHNIGVAWISGGGLHFAAFDDQLQRIFDWSPSRSSAAQHVAVAASASGWIIAAEYEAELTLYALDARGSALGVPQTLPRGRATGSAALGVGAGGAPLLVWNAPGANAEGDVAQAAVLGEDGRLITSPRTLWPNPQEPASILFVAGGFVVAQRASSAINTARVSLDGAAPALNASPLGEQTESPWLLSFQQQLGIVYFDYGPPEGTVNWAVLDTNGKVVTQGTPVLPQPAHYNGQFSAIADGMGALMLGQTSQPSRLELLGIDAQGRTPAKPYTIANSGAGFGTPLLARMGTKAVAAWLTGPGNRGFATVGLAIVSLNVP